MLTCLKIQKKNVKKNKQQKKPNKTTTTKKTHQHQHLNHIKNQQKTFVINYNYN